jgi:hypothetical protein
MDVRRASSMCLPAQISEGLSKIIVQQAFSSFKEAQSANEATGAAFVPAKGDAILENGVKLRSLGGRPGNGKFRSQRRRQQSRRAALPIV